MLRKQSSTLANEQESNYRSPALGRSGLMTLLASIFIAGVPHVVTAQQFGFGQPPASNQGVLPSPNYPGIP